MKIHLTQDDVTDILLRYFFGKFQVDLRPGKSAVTVQPMTRGGAVVELSLDTDDLSLDVDDA